jgi:nucleoid-associated protein YgaU
VPKAPQLDTNAPPHYFNCKRIRNIIFCAALAASTIALIAPRANAQDLGEIARQERAKKQNNPAPPATHVYTNEDLRRQQILTPDDQSRFSATTQPATAKPPQSATQLASDSTPHPAEPIAPKIATTLSVQTLQPASTIEVIAAKPVAQISAAQIATQNIVAPIPAIIPLDQISLGDVARFYRARKHESARANAQTIPCLLNAPSAPALATKIPDAMPSDQMSLGDVARYYRVKAREEAEEVAATQAPPSATPARAIAPISKYPLTLATTPLASMKPPPARIPKRLSSRIAPKRSVGGNAISIRINSGDTLWQLARKYLGTGSRWTELLALNPAIQNPRHLQVGAQLVLHTPTV